MKATSLLVLLALSSHAYSEEKRNNPDQGRNSSHGIRVDDNERTHHRHYVHGRETGLDRLHRVESLRDMRRQNAQTCIIGDSQGQTPVKLKKAGGAYSVEQYSIDGLKRVRSLRFKTLTLALDHLASEIGAGTYTTFHESQLSPNKKYCEIIDYTTCKKVYISGSKSVGVKFEYKLYDTRKKSTGYRYNPRAYFKSEIQSLKVYRDGSMQENSDRATKLVDRLQELGFCMEPPIARDISDSDENYDKNNL